MLTYIQEFIIQRRFGYGYLFTNAMVVLAVILLLKRDLPKGKKGWAGLAVEWMVCCAVYVLLDSVYMAHLGMWQMDRLMTAFFIILYAVIRSRYSFRVCLVRGWVFFASEMVMLPISEPMGRLFGGLNPDWYAWAQYLTPVIMAGLLIAEVWFLRHFAFKTDTAVGAKYVWMQVFISAMTILIEAYAAFSETAQTDWGFNVLVCICLWIINLVVYYQFYIIDQGTQENMDLNALRQKAELEKEKYHATRLNYDELRSIRHEIKNHNFYLKALLDEGKIDQAKEYLDRVSAQGTKYLKSFDSGNYAVDVVMTHELAAAKEMNVTLNPQILVPRTLPYRDEDVCSLLSNLLDNAMEAAAQSGVENPTVDISMLPRQEYLFIRVTNPVNKDLPEKRRMTLETTKASHTELHGFGTRIIRRIAERYNGSVKYSMADGVFTTDVMLEMPEEGTNPKDL